CLPGTRIQILTRLNHWALTSKGQVFWMSGMTGTGKSTIANTLCKIFGDNKILAGTFFCSRQLPACREYTKIIPTIVYQLAHFSQEFADALVKELQNDLDVINQDVPKQMALLLNPWKAIANDKKLAGVTPVIVIDALDEC
ncbi:hypothetical protein GYMLUDRAFT_143802, partial [Collybiopsis luxurians FD-317 M1]